MNIKLLKQKDFSLLMLGQLVSLLGTQMQGFALSLYVLKITGSATKFASVFAITMIPKLILGPIAGVFADWFDRKKIIVFLDIISGIIVAIFAVIYKINGGLSLSHIYVLAILFSIISLLFNPAVATVVPSIIKKEELMDANAIRSFILNIVKFISPIIAGILLGFYDLFILLVINSFSFLLSAISEIFINIPRTNKEPEQINIDSFLKDFSEGIKYIKGNKLMLNIIVLALVCNFVLAPIDSIGILFILKKMLNITDSQYGVFESILIISIMIAPISGTIISKKIKLGRMIFLGHLAMAILYGVVAVISSTQYLNLFTGNLIPYISLIIVYFVIILVSSIVNIAIYTMLQGQVPLSMMGRINSVNSSLSMAAIPLGQMVFGVLFDKTYAWICIGISAVLTFIFAMVFRRNLLDCDKNEAENSAVENSDKIQLV
ncbi:MFS transporter [Wukongibacter sp. M2B1]|uniref:MFS transporter n=1 Tax=Wukongibacter sp. M2B1 TaxID=3088895 RepID=UPI003D7B59ED